MKYKYTCLTILLGNSGNRDSQWILLGKSDKNGVIKILSINNWTRVLTYCDGSPPLPPPSAADPKYLG